MLLQSVECFGGRHNIGFFYLLVLMHVTVSYSGRSHICGKGILQCKAYNVNTHFTQLCSIKHINDPPMGIRDIMHKNNNGAQHYGCRR